MSLTVIIVGAIAVLVVIVLLIPVLQRSNKVELTKPSDSKPEWMRDMPPAETVAKTLADPNPAGETTDDPRKAIAESVAKRRGISVEAALKLVP